MKKVDMQKEFSLETQRIYQGILFNNREFESGNDQKIRYNFDSDEFNELKEKYQLENIAKKGSEFVRAKRLLKYLAPRLYHSSWYDNHIECNALKLLEYSLDNKEQGINCLNKSKILQECCLAINIFARRVGIMPFSPYDFDNHVVIEIYDSTLNKWIMLDPTTNGYFIDENKLPLALLEIREKFAKDEFVTFVRATDSLKDIYKLRDKYVFYNSYICKNLFYFVIDQDNKFGIGNSVLYFVPKNYKINNVIMGNLQYRINNLPKEYENLKGNYYKKLGEMVKKEEPIRTNLENMIISPER